MSESRRAKAHAGGQLLHGVEALADEQSVYPPIRLSLQPGLLRDPLASFVTDWGSDPVWQSADPGGQPGAFAFRRRVATASGLTLAELSERFTVTVAAHEVSYDTARRLWYSDIDVALEGTYFPFVRLALARYQPHSLPGTHLSRVVMADFMQLLPDRTAEVSVTADVALITVSGLSARGIVDQIRQSRFDPIRESRASDPADSPRPGTEIWVSLQRREPHFDGDLAWRTIGDPMRLSIANAERFNVTWSGSLRLPTYATDGEHRLLITETETYLRDGIAGDPPFEVSPLDHTRSRIVYADDFELPSH